MVGYTEDELTKMKYHEITIAEPSLVKANIEYLRKSRTQTHYMMRQYMRKDDSIFSVETCSSLISFNDAESIIIIVHDLSERLQTEKALEQSYEHLKNTLNATVAALTMVSEKRDSYTTGHQQRVAQLSCAIATQMGLSGKQIEGIAIVGHCTILVRFIYLLIF